MDDLDPRGLEPRVNDQPDDPLEAERRQAFMRSGLLEAFWNETLEPEGWGNPPQFHLRVVRAVLRLREWVKNGGALYLYGDEVRSALAMTAAADCIRKTPPEQVRFVAEADIFWMITFRNIKGLKPQFRLDTYQHAGVLVLDGLGMRQLNAYMRDVLFDLFRLRLRDPDGPRKTLLTGRLPPDALEGWLLGVDPRSTGPELAAMFREMIGGDGSVCVIPPFPGPADPDWAGRR